MNPPRPGTLLSVDALCGGYGNIPVLNRIGLRVAEGEIVGVLGHNGMGKTTLLKQLMGLVPTTSGSILFDGVEIQDHPTHQRALAGMGYVPQGRGIFPRLTVTENLRFALSGESDAEFGKEAQEKILDYFPQLIPLLNRKGGNLSGGEQQILAIARCLVTDPVLVLLDEPTEGIQPSVIETIIAVLGRIRDEDGLTVLVVEQNLEFLRKLCDRLLVIERGQVVAEISDMGLHDNEALLEFMGLGQNPDHPALPSTSVSEVKPSPGKTPEVPPEPVMQSAVPEPEPETEEGPAATSANCPPTEAFMSVKRPSLEQMREMARALGMAMADEELRTYLGIMEPYIQGYDLLHTKPDYLPRVRYPRTPGYQPPAEENPLNAWYYKCEVKGAPGGALAGKRIVLKDTVCLAGVPMMNGASVLEGYIPDIDATIVNRILDAGGTIVGKSHCEYLCLSGGSHTNATGPVHNPYKRGYMAGGSSSGSAALVAAGEVDMAIAGDQGGSIRIPSSNCGCYGMKATHGLVPYTGIFPIEQTIDHVGPVTCNVADNALFLEILAGEDGLDPRQYKPSVHRYTDALGQGAGGLRIGILQEGFDRPESEPDVDAKVRQAIRQLEGLGARVEKTSIPGHLEGPAFWTAIAVEGLQDLMMHGNSSGTNYRGLFMPNLTDFFSNWRLRADELSSSLKVCMFLGEYFQTRYRGRFYGKAQNLVRWLRAQYDQAFRKYDLLVMPTLPMKAREIPPPDAPLELSVQRAFEMVGNTCPFNACGYPAMTVPCGMSEGLPVGMMLVADHYGELTIYRAAHAFEQLGDWRDR
ncbi:MAG: amidase [Gammaproteobacteria bacterium]|nr:amidase [Gammaproteobacteria bacterium]